MTPLTKVPAALRGRGAVQSLAIKCDCGETFLWPNITTPFVVCPTCRRTETITEDAPILNGQST